MNKVGCKALILSAGFRGNDYIATLRALAPELDAAQPGRLEAARLPDLRIVIRLGERENRRRPQFRRRRRAGLAGAARRTRRARKDAAVRRSHQHPVHQRHHRRAQGRDADPSQHPQQRLFHRRGDAPDAGRPAVHPGAATIIASAWCWATRPASPTAPAWSVPPKGSTRWRCSRRSRRSDAPALHGVPTMFIADARSSRIRAVRSDQPAHRHHGRLALSGRSDAQRGLAR